MGTGVHNRPFPNWKAASLGSWQSLLEEPGVVLNSSPIPWRQGVRLPHLHPSLSVQKPRLEVVNKWNEPTAANSPSLAPRNPGSVFVISDMLGRNDMVSSGPTTSRSQSGGEKELVRVTCNSFLQSHSGELAAAGAPWRGGGGGVVWSLVRPCFMSEHLCPSQQRYWSPVVVTAVRTHYRTEWE